MLFHLSWGGHNKRVGPPCPPRRYAMFAHPPLCPANRHKVSKLWQEQIKHDQKQKGQIILYALPLSWFFLQICLGALEPLPPTNRTAVHNSHQWKPMPSQQPDAVLNGCKEQALLDSKVRARSKERQEIVRQQAPFLHDSSYNDLRNRSWCVTFLCASSWQSIVQICANVSAKNII